MVAMISRLRGPFTRAGVAVFVLFASVVAVVRQSLDPATANHDVAWTLYAGERLLAGAEYGVDIIELNPPFILWVGSLVALFNRLFELPIILVFNLLVLGLIAGYGFSLIQVLKRAGVRGDLAISVAIMMAAALVYLPSYAYGQRDHLIFILMTPHLLLSALCVDRDFDTRAGFRVLAGTAMAVALCMKPHYGLAWVGAELAMLYCARRSSCLLRTENWVAATGCLACGAYLVVFEPRYFDAARAAIALYGAYDGLISVFDWRFAPMAASAALLLWLRPRGAIGRCAAVSVVASIAGFIAIEVQGKGYDYHFLPCQLSAFLGLSCTLLARLQQEGEGSERVSPLVAPAAAVGALLLAIAMAGSALLFGSDEIYMPNRNLVQFIEKHGRGEPVLFLSDSVSPAFPVLTMTGNRATSPYSCLWQIAGHYSPAELSRSEFPYRSLDEMSDREREMIVGLVDRIEHEPPTLILFDDRKAKFTFRGASFSYERYFKADERFDALLQDYRLLARVGGYRALVRNPTAIRSLPRTAR